jgi:hypothetical protein
LLSTVAPHHFAELFVELDRDDFWLFGSTIEPFGSIVELTANALRIFGSAKPKGYSVELNVNRM